MNLLAFESVAQYREVLHDDTFVKLGHKKWPTVGSETMKKHAYTEWQPDAPYVILLNQYRKRDNNEWVKGFKGKRLCVIDGDDGLRYWEPFVDVADIYIKENSYTPTDRPNVRVGCYCPSMKVPFLLKKHGIKWRDERKLDMLFCGDMHEGRQKHVNRWRRYCEERGWKYKFGNEHTYDRPRYLSAMSKTRVCPSMLGHGARCRREWEALLCGATLCNDQRLRDYPLVIMEPEKHFSFKPVWDEKIAIRGHHLAIKCWMHSPSIDIRMAALYLFFDVPQMWTYTDVADKECNLGLR